MLFKAKTFPGGYRFKKFSGPIEDKLVCPELPSKVIIPLSQGFGIPLNPIVKVGDKVRAGQVIARDDDNVSSPVHSSVTGKVTEIKKTNYFNRSVTMVIVEDIENGDYKKLEGHASEWRKLSAEKIEELIYESGVASSNRQGIPTRFKSSIISPENVEDLIINGAGSEPYNISLDLLLEGRNLFNFVEAMKMLMKIMAKAKVHVALSSENKPLIERMKKLTSDIKGLEIIPVVPKYPQGYDEVLIPTLLKKDFPYGYSAANIDIVVLDIQALLHVYEAVTDGKPLIERMVALLGPGFKSNNHCKVRVGTPVEYLLKNILIDSESRVMLNSALTGIVLDDLTIPVDRTFTQIISIPEDRERKFLKFITPGAKTDSYTNSFLSSLLPSEKSLSTNQNGDERPCIQCGSCVEVCPVRINPSFINRMSKMRVNESLMRFGVFKCIDCNLCSYVCPSKIPLGPNIAKAKQGLIEIGCDHMQCVQPKVTVTALDEYKGVTKLR